MKVMLVFPPQAQPFLPYLSTPQLKAFLKENNIEVIQRDFNIEAYEDFLNPDYLKKKGSSEEFLSALDEAKKYLRSGCDFFLEEKYYNSIDILEKALEAVCGDLSHTQWTLKRYDIFSSITSSSKSLFRAVKDGKSNIFLDYFEKKLDEIKEISPHIIGISVAWKSQLIPAFTLAFLVKKYLPHIHISMGGTLITHLVENICQNKDMFSWVDSYHPFEGEESLLSLAKCLPGGEFKKVPGIIYAEDGNIKFTRPLCKDFNSLPFADFSDLPLDKYYSPQIYLPLSASRGCYWSKCAFCSHHFSGNIFRKRDSKNIFDEMNFLYERYGAENFYFVDDALPPKDLLEIASMIKREECPYRWAGEMRFEEMMDRDYFSGLFDGGCRLLLFGLESYSQNVLNMMNKGFKKETVLPVLKGASDAGIMTWVFFFLGFPGEKRAEALETLDFILSNRHYIDMVGCGPFILTKNSPLFFSPEHFQIKKIYPSKSQDLQLDYPFLPVSGLQRYEADKMLEDFWEKPEVEKFLKPFISEPHLLFFEK